MGRACMCVGAFFLSYCLLLFSCLLQYRDCCTAYSKVLKNKTLHYACSLLWLIFRSRCKKGMEVVALKSQRTQKKNENRADADEYSRAQATSYIWYILVYWKCIWSPRYSPSWLLYLGLCGFWGAGVLIYSSFKKRKRKKKRGKRGKKAFPTSIDSSQSGPVRGGGCMEEGKRGVGKGSISVFSLPPADVLERKRRNEMDNYLVFFMIVHLS